MRPIWQFQGIPHGLAPLLPKEKNPGVSSELCGLVGPKGGSKEKITIRGFREDLAASFAPFWFGAAMGKYGSWGVRMFAMIW